MMRKKPITAADGAREVRCLCGQLIAKFVPQGLEMRCKRCKRVHVLSFRSPNAQIHKSLEDQKKGRESPDGMERDSSLVYVGH